MDPILVAGDQVVVDVGAIGAFDQDAVAARESTNDHISNADPIRGQHVNTCRGMRIPFELKAFNQQLGIAWLIADGSGDRVTGSGIGKNCTRIAAQLIFSVGVQFQANSCRERVVSRGYINGALQGTGFKGMVHAVANVSSRDAGRYQGSLR